MAIHIKQVQGSEEIMNQVNFVKNNLNGTVSLQNTNLVTTVPLKISQNTVPQDNNTFVTKGYVDNVMSVGLSGLPSLAPLHSPVFTGTPQAPTPSLSSNDTTVATTAFIGNKIQNFADTIIEGLSAALDTSLSDSADAVALATAISDQLDEKQDKHAALTSISNLTTSANKMIYTTASNTYATTSLSPFARTVLDDNDAATFRTTVDVFSKAEVRTEISNLVNSAPQTLDTLKELADALGNDPNFATTISTELGNRQPLNAALTSISGLSTAANKMIYTTAKDTYAVTPVTDHGRSLINTADAAATRSLISAPSITGEGASGTWNITATNAVTAATTTGNAGTATTLKTPRTISISDNSGTNTATGTSFNGSEDITIKMPATIKGALNGNAATTTKLKDAVNINITDAAGTNTGLATTFDGSKNVTIKLPSTIAADLTGTASNATADVKGNVIDTTYETKANAITSLSVDGRVITYTKGDGNTGTITTQDTGDTHWTTKLIVGGATDTDNAATANGNTNLRLFDDNTVRSTIKLTGAGATTVTSDATGTITVTSNNNAVNQTNSTTNADYAILLKKDNTTTTAIDGTFFNTGVYVNPSTKTVKADIFDGRATDAAQADNITGTVAVANGGTGLTSSPSMLTDLASTAADNILKASPRPGVTGTLSVANGGTGQTSLANVRGIGSAIRVIHGAMAGTEADNLVYTQMANNDYFRIRVGGTATNAGWGEIAIGDDGNEPIYVRQYTGSNFADIVRTATLLDESGNTTFPNTVTAPTFSGYLSGTAEQANKDSAGNNIVSTYETKANAITSLGISGHTLTYGRGNNTSGTLTLPDENTHWTSRLYVGAENSSVKAATTNGNTFITVTDDNTARNSVKIVGSGSTSVTSNNANVITVSSTDQKMTQTNSTANASYAILLKKNNTTTAETADAYFSTNVYVNPSTKTITATTFSGNATSATKATQDGDGKTISSTYAKLASPALTGTPTAPTAEADTDTDQIATTAFVNTAIENLADDLISGLSAALSDSFSDTSAANALATAISDQLDEKQDKHAALTSISGLTTSADKMIYTTASNTYSTTPLTSTARSLLDDTSVSAMRTTLSVPARDGTNASGTWSISISGLAAKATADAGGNTITTTYAKLASPALTGTPTAPTATAGTNTTQIATTAFVNTAVDTAVTNLLGSAPTTLDTLNELATALGNDPNFATTMATSLGGKQPLHAALTSISGLSTAADKMIYTTASDTYAVTTLTSKARELLDDADIATMRQTLSVPARDGSNAKGTWSIGITGNAATATKLIAGQTVDGVSFDGSSPISHYCVCSTAEGTAAKTAALTGFSLVTGAKISVKFTKTNTAANPTLNVNDTGAKAIYYRGAAITAGYLAANRTYTFVYNGSQYELIGDIDTNTTYSAATTSTDGLMSSSDKTKLNGIQTGATAVSISRNLTSGTKIGTITINGTGTDLYCQTNTNTDTLMTQTVSTTNATYPLLATATANATQTATTTAVFATGVKLNPGTGVITATGFSGPLTGNVTGNVSGSAGSATNDSAGQQINTTYIKDLSVSGATITYTKGDNTTGTVTVNVAAATDTQVSQNVSTANATYPILATPTADAATDQGAKTAIFASGIKINPSTNTISATTFVGNVTGNVSGSAGSCTGNAATATKATQDGSGNTITSTYAKLSGATFTGGITGTTATFSGTLTLTKTQDLSGTANSGPALVVGGTATSTHIEIDTNEIHAKATGTTTAPLYLNNDGGQVIIGTGGLQVKGDIDATGKTVTATTFSGKATSAGTADSATKATQDGSGNTITSTYATKAQAVTGFSVDGTTVTFTRADGTTGTFVTQDTNTDTNTHYTTHLYAGTSTGVANASTSNGATYLILADDSTARNRVKLTGSGGTTVTSDASGNITISSTTSTPNTDTLVTQTVSTVLNDYPILASANANATTTATTTSVFSKDVKVNPHYGTISANGFNVNPASDSGTVVMMNYLREHPLSSEKGVTMAASHDANTDEVTFKIIVGESSKENISMINVQSQKIYMSSTEVELYTSQLTVGTISGKGTVIANLQGNVTGNAATATTAAQLTTARTIDGVNFDGQAAISHYGTCSTAAATAAKTVALSNFILVTGSRITVKFTVTNTAANPTLNVNGTGAKAIYYRGAAVPAAALQANSTYDLVYNGTQYDIIGSLIWGS